MLTLKNCLPATALFIFVVHVSLAQSPVILGQNGCRTIITAAPFLMITPDARTAGLGEAGVALSADANAAYWNPAKLVLLPEKSNFSFSLTPWLSEVVNDMYHCYFSAAQKLGEKNALGLSFTYFNLGDIQLTNPAGYLLSLQNPYDLSASISYARALSKQWSIGGSAKYIGNYSGNSSASGIPQNASNFAVDVGVLYQKDFSLFQKESLLALGANVANLGPKMTYYNDELFLPANLSLGSSISSALSRNHSLAWSVNLRKLLVPTPDSTLAWSEKGWFSGTFGSFADAPGGFAEEMREIMIGTGLEYSFKELLAVRTGYYHEAEDKGDKSYFTTGLGVHYQMISLDLAYLLLIRQNHPLQNTLRVGLQLRFGEMV